MSLITRGVLIDVAALKGVEMLPDAYEITPADLQQALERQKLTLQPGDARPHPHRLEQAVGERQRSLRQELPGHRHRRGDVARQAGSDARRRRQLASRGRAQPGHAALPLPVHQFMLVVSGIHLLENLKLDELAAKQVHEFAFVVQPLKMQGFTGSTVAPIAIR